MTDKYAVVGNPIAHSKSPAIHMAFAKQTQQDIVYEKKLIELGDFEKDVKAFFAEGGKGLNVTVPFKEEAFQFVDQLTTRAQLAGAVNTLALQPDNTVLGDTTDGAGLLADLKRNAMPLKDANILVLGAGGAVRGILEPLLAEKPANVVVANRTASKAQKLQDIFEHLGDIKGCGFDELDALQFNTIINGTSASLSGDLPPVPASIFASDASAYDMMYGKNLTPFLIWAKEQGCKQVCDGLGMLVGQAAESFMIWRGVLPEVQELVAKIRLEL